MDEIWNQGNRYIFESMNLRYPEDLGNPRFLFYKGQFYLAIM